MYYGGVHCRFTVSELTDYIVLFFEIVDINRSFQLTCILIRWHDVFILKSTELLIHLKLQKVTTIDKDIAPEILCDMI